MVRKVHVVSVNKILADRLSDLLTCVCFDPLFRDVAGDVMLVWMIVFFDKIAGLIISELQAKHVKTAEAHLGSETVCPGKQPGRARCHHRGLSNDVGDIDSSPAACRLCVACGIGHAAGAVAGSSRVSLGHGQQRRGQGLLLFSVVEFDVADHCGQCLSGRICGRGSTSCSSATGAWIDRGDVAVESVPHRPDCVGRKIRQILFAGAMSERREFEKHLRSCLEVMHRPGFHLRWWSFEMAEVQYDRRDA